YIAAAALIVVFIGFGAVRVVRRRREVRSETEEVAPATFAGGSAAAYSPSDTDVGLATRSRDITEEVDPLEEAEIFLAYGRDAQAEELLKEALASSPRRFEIYGKLLEIFAKRGDTQAFETTAREVQQGTSGRGEIWDRAVRLGYQIDPGNPRYAAGRPTGEEAPAHSEGAAPAERLDYDVGMGDGATIQTTADIDLGTGGLEERTQKLTLPEDLSASTAPSEPTSADLNIELPSEARAEPQESQAKPAAGANTIDFDFDVSPPGTPTEEPASASKPADLDAGMDFDVGSLSLDSGADQGGSASTPSLDLSAISLDLEDTATSPAGPAGKDERWYDVQTKFDLAKAYQEMGDKDGAREILKEVIAEGDAEQQAAAEAVLSSLK
ncbi:MAG: FimV/HubP family polar landmark protein, partial [Burkholderiales bacterium]